MPPLIIAIIARALIMGAVAGAISSTLALLRVEGDRQRDEEEERKHQNKNKNDT